jgi:hypothetical protein
MERRFDDGVDRVEELPQDAARWTGEAVGEVEAVPDRVEQGWDRTEDRVEQGWDRAEDKVEHGWDNTVDAIENAPENIAHGIGEGVGDVERFGDRVESYGEGLEESYDAGRDERRYDY